ncbi:hypothetical protein JXL21_09155 [Candidatus Bathyarchaeota archaeon]|nr:hypothetical protein [Candidatus Bathyarchaeota archaeon]
MAKTTLVHDPVELDASVEKVKTLATGTVYPGHGEPFTVAQMEEQAQ